LIENGANHSEEIVRKRILEKNQSQESEGNQEEVDKEKLKSEMKADDHNASHDPTIDFIERLCCLVIWPLSLIMPV